MTIELHIISWVCFLFPESVPKSLFITLNVKANKAEKTSSWCLFLVSSYVNICSQMMYSLQQQDQSSRLFLPCCNQMHLLFPILGWSHFWYPCFQQSARSSRLRPLNVTPEQTRVRLQQRAAPEDRPCWMLLWSLHTAAPHAFPCCKTPLQIPALST